MMLIMACVYQVEYTVFEAGVMDLKIMLGDKPISGSPFSVYVESAEACELSEMTETELTFYAGVRSEISVDAKDKFGNDKTSGGSLIAPEFFPAVKDVEVSAFVTSFERLLP